MELCSDLADDNVLAGSCGLLAVVLALGGHVDELDQLTQKTLFRRCQRA